jgi:hypothetical protein
MDKAKVLTLMLTTDPKSLPTAWCNDRRPTRRSRSHYPHESLKTLKTTPNSSLQARRS